MGKSRKQVPWPLLWPLLALATQEDPMTEGQRPSPEKPRDQVLATKKALKSDQRSKPEANIPMTEDPRSSPVTKKSRDKAMATKTAILGDQRSSPEADTLETKDKKSSPENYKVPRTYSKTNRSKEQIILKSEIFKESTVKVGNDERSCETSPCSNRCDLYF